LVPAEGRIRFDPDPDPLRWIEDWVGSTALAGLVKSFGGGGFEGLAPDQRLARLEGFSERWDFRAGRERNLVADIDFGPERAAEILAAATDLGLRGINDPRRRRYDLVVILGGLLRACLGRPLKAASLIEAGTIETPRVVALGGFRPLRGDELELAARMLDDAVADEYEGIGAGLRAAFDLGEPSASRGCHSDTLGVSWAVDDYEGGDGPAVHLAAVPSSEPGVRRANTPDGYEWLAAESGWLGEGSSVLIITTDIYRPYQYADALRLLSLPHGIEVDLVGTPPGEVEPRLARELLPHSYLQEMRSTIRSLRLLREAALAVARD
jgi:hypothetical protein